MGANCQVMFVWLWPLKERCIEDVKFWVDNQCYEYDFLLKMYTLQFSVRKSYDVMERDALW